MKKTALYGMGAWIELRYFWLMRLSGLDIVGVYDKNPQTKGKAEILGLRFLTEEEILNQDYDELMITSNYENEILSYCKRNLGIRVSIVSGNSRYDQWKNDNNRPPYCFGEKNKGKEYTIITNGEDYCTSGLLSWFNICTHCILQSYLDDRIPIIDMKYYKNIYHNDLEEMGKVDSWGMFFGQPVETTLEEIYQSDDVKIVVAQWHSDVFQPKTYLDMLKEDKLKALHQVFIKNVGLSDRIKKEYKDAYKKLFENRKKNGEKVLGISLRGTDYTNGKPLDHYIQPSFDEIMEKADKVIKEFDISWVYVNSDEERLVDEVKKRYPGMTFSMDYQRYDAYKYDGKDTDVLGNMRFDREDDGYHRGADYLVSTLLFTDCDCFLAGLNGGSMATMIMADGFEYAYLFEDLGMYGRDEARLFM